MTRVDRRTFLQLLGAGAATLSACGTPEGGPPLFDARATPPSGAWPDADPEDATAFPEGVAAGDVTADAAILWTHYAGDAELTLVLAAWDGSAWATTDHRATPVEGYVHVDLATLKADTHYAYQFRTADGAASAVGRFNTAPPADHTGPVTFAATACLHQSREDYPSVTHAVNRGPLDLFLFLGDTAYFDGLPNIEAFRNLYAHNLRKPAFQAAMGHTSCVYTWDDHEFDNNFDPETIDPDYFQMCADAWFEHLPVRRSATHPNRIWRSMRYGRTAEFFILDCRAERRPSQDLYISPEQLDWLIDGLRRSESTWKVISNSVPIAGLQNEAWNVPFALRDRWQGYEAQRAELIRRITEAGIPGVIFVSGDVHCAFIARVDHEGPGRRLFDLVAGPAGSFRNPLARFLVDGDQIPWGNGDWNTMRVELTASGHATAAFINDDDDTVAWLHFDDEGRILDLFGYDEVEDTTGPIPFVQDP